jgi:predicted phosphodiesterase
VALYGLFTDPHFAQTPPVNCTDSYLPDLLGLLDQGLNVFRERGVAAAICAGDLFHHKAPTRTSHDVVGALGERFLAQGYPVWLLPGNHDMQHDRMESVAGQPLGTLFRTRAASCLDGWMADHPVFGVPWQQHWSAEGVSQALTEWREYTPFQATAEHDLVVTHAPLYPTGSEPAYDGAEFTPADWWAEGIGGAPGVHSVFYGHIHEPHGTWQRRGVTFCNNGALSRGSVDDYNMTRTPGVTLWDSGSGEFEFVPLNARPAAEVFRLADRELKLTTTMSLDRFLGEMGTTVLPKLTPETVLEHVRSAKPGDDVVQLCSELVDFAQDEGKRR